MRKLMVLLGIVLVAGAVGVMGHRWIDGSARYARYHQPDAGVSRSASERSRSSPGERRSESRSGSRGLSSLKLFELVIDVLNVLVGVVGIGLAITGVRMQRAASAGTRLTSGSDR